jgi:hypothetical protein
MFRRLLFALALAASSVAVSGQGRPVLVVNPFTTAPDVALPYDLSQLQGQMVAELKVMLGKSFDIAAEKPAGASGNVYMLDAEIAAWRAGNAAKRLLVGLGSGRESADVQYVVTDAAGTKVVARTDTIRTNFYSQGAGSTGTLAHPLAQKMAKRIKDAKLK